ncbi:MAG: hypothetical protein LBS95_02865 [Mycoplasmataceae bacterium]|nr:hypothetical protein [Mycoplasmataceae bacterium]
MNKTKIDPTNNVLTAKEHKVWNRRKVVKVALACTCGVVGIGGGIGIGLFFSKKVDHTISFSIPKNTLTYGSNNSSEVITASSSDNISLSASGEGKDTNWNFDEYSGTLSYFSPFYYDVDVTISATTKYRTDTATVTLLKKEITNSMTLDASGINNITLGKNQNWNSQYLFYGNDEILTNAVFTVSFGDLPGTMALSSDGILSGNSGSQAGSSNFSISMQAFIGGNLITGKDYQVSWTVQEVVTPYIQVVGNSNLELEVGKNFSQRYKAYNTQTGLDVTETTTWTVSPVFSLPKGINWNGVTHTLSGFLIDASILSNNFTITASDASQTATLPLKIEWTATNLAPSVKLAINGLLINDNITQTNFVIQPLNGTLLDNVVPQCYGIDFTFSHYSITGDKIYHAIATPGAIIGKNVVSVEGPNINPSFLEVEVYDMSNTVIVDGNTTTEDCLFYNDTGTTIFGTDNHTCIDLSNLQKTSNTNFILSGTINAIILISTSSTWNGDISIIGNYDFVQTYTDASNCGQIMYTNTIGSSLSQPLDIDISFVNINIQSRTSAAIYFASEITNNISILGCNIFGYSNFGIFVNANMSASSTMIVYNSHFFTTYQYSFYFNSGMILSGEIYFNNNTFIGSSATGIMFSSTDYLYGSIWFTKNTFLFNSAGGLCMHLNIAMKNNSSIVIESNIFSSSYQCFGSSNLVDGSEPPENVNFSMSNNHFTSDGINFLFYGNFLNSTFLFENNEFISRNSLIYPLYLSQMFFEFCSVKILNNSSYNIGKISYISVQMASFKNSSVDIIGNFFPGGININSGALAMLDSFFNIENNIFASTEATGNLSFNMDISGCSFKIKNNFFSFNKSNVDAIRFYSPITGTNLSIDGNIINNLNPNLADVGGVGFLDTIDEDSTISITNNQISTENTSISFVKKCEAEIFFSNNSLNICSSSTSSIPAISFGDATQNSNILYGMNNQLFYSCPQSTTCTWLGGDGASNVSWDSTPDSPTESQSIVYEKTSSLPYDLPNYFLKFFITNYLLPESKNYANNLAIILTSSSIARGSNPINIFLLNSLIII